MRASYLWETPEINPINRKARSIPVFNVVNVYGRVFFFSWFGFTIAFWAWYAFPPLLTHSIKSNLNLSTTEVANSNIVSLSATLLVRYLAGPASDLFGPRKVFAGILLIGSVPLGLAPLVTSAQGLYVSRFFIGILGGSFVPCQVWCSAFFDKNVVGTANGLAGGWGNAGGGITYFVMPAVFDSLVRMGHSEGVAWRLSFLVPLVLTLTSGIAMLIFCPDTPTGKWSERHLHAKQNLVSHGVSVPSHQVTSAGVLDVSGGDTEKASTEEVDPKEKDVDMQKLATLDHEVPLSENEMVEVVEGEIIRKPTVRGVLRILASPQTIFQVITYVCSFGAELAINSILSAYYIKNFPWLGQTNAANWAAMFGFLNFATRPLGGVIGDVLYKATGHSLWAKKIWIVTCGVLAGALLIIIGQLDPHYMPTMVGLVALMAIFLEAGNGANFALVPHIHPHANGVVSGTTGAAGNLGGIIFSIVFRFMDGGANYAKGFWATGIIIIGLNLALCWIPPLPRGQIGGH